MKKLLFLSFICIILLSQTSHFYAQEVNLIKNGDFESFIDGFPQDWNKVVPDSYQGSVSENSYNETKCLEIINQTGDWIEYTQTVPIDSVNNYYVKLESFIEIINIIPGEYDWETFGITLSFLDENDQLLDNIIEFGRWDQSKIWSYYEEYFDIPKNSKKCRICISLGNCEGDVKIDDISLYYGKIEKEEDLTNLIYNGGFEYGNFSPDDWFYWGNDESQLIYPGKESRRCFYLYSKENKYYNVCQKADISELNISELEVSADYKIENVVQGAYPWEQAQIVVAFYDNNDQFLPGSPIVLDEGIGSYSSWKNVSGRITVPSGAKYFRFFAALTNTTGQLWLDNVIINGFDEYGIIINKKDIEKIDYASWTKFESTHNAPAVWPYFNISYLLDTPAGIHGFAKNDNGVIRFDDGTRARFFGFNLAIVDIKLSNEYSVRLAERLASIGCNMLRIHLKVTSEEYYNDFDFLVSELIKNGIYIYIDMIVEKQYGEEDGFTDASDDIPFGFKGVTYFEDNVIQFEKTYIKNFLNHYNPYLGKQYFEEAGIACINIINESSLYNFDNIFPESNYYRDKLDQLFNNWLLIRYENHENLINSWNEIGAVWLDDGENLQNLNIKRAAFDFNYEDWYSSGSSQDCPGRVSDTKRFYHELQRNFYEMMYDHMRSLGYKGLISGSNHWERFDADLYSYSNMDIVDHHHYFDHPNPNAGFEPENVKFKNSDMLKTLSNIITGVASTRNKDLPLFVSEWGISYPNESRFIGPVIMASYSCLQDWDGILQVSFDSDNWPEKIDDIFDISQSPSLLSQWLVAALIFHKGYVRPSYLTITDKIGPQDIFNKRESSFKYIGNDLVLPLISRVQKEYSLTEPSQYADPSSIINQFNNSEYNFVMSDTYELLWDYKDGFFIINNDYVQGVMGNLNGREFDFTDIKIQTYSKTGSIILISLDSKPIKESENMLLVTSGREFNEDTEFHHTYTTLTSAGRSPICLEPVECKMNFKNRTGLEIEFYNVSGTKNWYTLDLDDFNNEFYFVRDYKTLFYQIKTK